jgi:glucose/arabinose dehydrogenase
MLSITAASLHAQDYRIDTLVADPETSEPTCIAFVPDGSGSFFYTEKNTGNVRLYEPGGVRPEPFATVPVTAGGEQGLLGITLHPSYPDSPFVYIYYTRSGDRANMVVRYRDQAGSGFDPETLLVVPRTDNAGNHNGGNIHFGPDDRLYVTIGEYGQTPAHAQDTSAGNPRGKILRLNADGSIPPDNPFPGKPFWSVGHRNSFDFTFDPVTGKMYCTENGPSCNDEVNRVPRGANMGWPVDGNCVYSGSPLYVRPLYYFPSNLPALTGIAVYRGSAFPRLYGCILFAGNSTARIWTLRLAADGDTIVAGSFSPFFEWWSGFADVEVGPDGFIYITNGPYQADQILRLRPTSPLFTSDAPTAAQPAAEYLYTPTFSGTPPAILLLEGPAGMNVDSATWSLRWTPSVGQAGQAFTVRLLAENGAGSDEQSWTVTTSLTDAGGDQAPGAIALLPNYPNPFNPATFLPYRLAGTSHVRLSVMDLLGRELALLVEGEVEAGEHMAVFTAEALASGVYVARLEVPGAVFTRRMILIR